MLSPSHKIFSMCRRKLYVMQNTSSSALHRSDSVPQHSTEKSSWADTSFLIQGVVDHEGHDQLATDAEGSTELPDEACDLNKTTRCTDEDGSGSGVAEASNDVKDRSESSPSSVTDLNEYVGAAWYEDTLAEDESTESSSSVSNHTDGSELDSELFNLNEGLASFGVSPISKYQMQRKGSSYSQKKIRKVVEVLSAKIGVSPDLDGRDADSEIVAQLMEQFKAISHRSEQIQILTVLPKSWSPCKTMQEVGVSNYMARCAKKLAEEKGNLSTPNPKHARCLPATTEDLAKPFYHSDDIS